MLEATARALPNEACGVVIDGVAYELPNVASDPVHHYAMDLVRLAELVETHGYPEAAWHSHPGGTPHPSTDDLRFHPPGVRLVIVTPDQVYDHGQVAT